MTLFLTNPASPACQSRHITYGMGPLSQIAFRNRAWKLNFHTRLLLPTIELPRRGALRPLPPVFFSPSRSEEVISMRSETLGRSGSLGLIEYSTKMENEVHFNYLLFGVKRSARCETFYNFFLPLLILLYFILFFLSIFHRRYKFPCNEGGKCYSPCRRYKFCIVSLIMRKSDILSNGYDVSPILHANIRMVWIWM